MPFLTYLLVALTAYLLGSIPFGYLLVWLFRKEDIRSQGSGNIGATNVVQVGREGSGRADLSSRYLQGIRGGRGRKPSCGVANADASASG